MKPAGLWVAVLVVTTLSGCAGRPAAQAAPDPEARTESDLAAIAKARADSLRLPYTAADIQFMSGMISHHAQAIAMANLVPSRAASPSIRVLAERIINAQTDEIALMQRWLRDRRQPVPDPSPGGARMVMNGVEHDMLMPGMLTPAQLKELEGAKGLEFDRLFLRHMIQHHRGAVTMVATLFATDGAGQDERVFKFASDANIDQTTEIARMERMLAALAPGRPSQ